MKKNKLKIITIILLIILLAMVGFFGVYVKSNGVLKNEVKDYEYSKDLSQKRVVTLEVSNETKEIIKDSKGNIIESATDDEIKKNGYKKEQNPVNNKEDLKVENYKLVKQIIENRLNKLYVSDYSVRLDENTGNIVVEFDDDDNVDNIITSLTTVGKFEIIDTETKEVLLNNDLIKTSQVLRGTTEEGTAIYISIEFNDEGKKKLEDITNKYAKVTENTTDSNTTTSNTAESNTTTSNTAESNTTTSNTTETNTTSTTNSDSKTEKTITMKMDDTEITSTSFDKPITDGKITLTVGKGATDTKTINENLKQARNMASVLSYKSLPLTYNTHTNTLVTSPMKECITKIVLIGIACFTLFVFIVLVFKYKSKGFLAAIASIGLTALLLLIIRYGNVVLSIEGLVALFVVLILNLVFTNKILKSMKDQEQNKKIETKSIINKAIIEMGVKFIPLLIVGVIFTFMPWTPTSSFGMVMFWGLALIVFYNLIITKNLLNDKKQK